MNLLGSVFYFLFLLLLTSPGMTLVTVNEPIAGISIREGSDNVVTMEDRLPWLQSIAGFISDLSNDTQASSQVLWALGQGLTSTAELDEKATPLIDNRSARWRWFSRRRSRS